MRSSVLLLIVSACSEDQAFTIKDGPTADTVDTEPGPVAPPVATADGYTIDQDTVLTVDAASGVLANDVASAGGALQAVLVTGPTSGALLLAADGAFEYRPNEGYAGTDTFSYQASEGLLQSSVVQVTVQVIVPNDPPVVESEGYATPLDTPLTVAAPGVLENDSDPEGDSLTVTLSTEVTHGTLALSPDGSFLYTPNPGYQGYDSFVYEVGDGYNDLVQGTVTLAVGDVPEPPIASDDTLQATSGVPRTIEEPGVLHNDSDPDGDPLTAVLELPPANGTIELASDGTITYTSDEGFVGVDTFTYHASDGALDSAPATVTVTVVANTPPSGTDDAYVASALFGLYADENDGVLSNDTDADGDPITAVLVDDVSNGWIVFNADGSFLYGADFAFFGTDSFTYEVTDGIDSSTLVTVEIDVQ